MNSKFDQETDRTMRQSVVASLDESVEHLDARTLSRLNRARHEALATHEKFHPIRPSWLTAGTFAVLFVSLMTGWMLFSAPGKAQLSPDEFEQVVANEDFELMQDLDFVAWMIAQDNAS
jgi:hypothetical protein